MSKTEDDSSPKSPRSSKNINSRTSSPDKRTAWEKLASNSSRSPSPSPRSTSCTLKKTGSKSNPQWNDSCTSDKQSSKWCLKNDIKNLIDNLGEKPDKQEISCSMNNTETSSLEAEPVKEKPKRYKHREKPDRLLKPNAKKNKLSPKHHHSLCETPSLKEINYKGNKVIKERTENLKQIDVTKMGFSESSSLSILQTCIDDPSILCHCRDKPSCSAPDLEQLTNNNNLRGYETAPNLSSSHIKNDSQLKENSDLCVSVEDIFQERTNGEICFCQDKTKDIILIDYRCQNHKLSSQELHMSPSPTCHELSVPTNYEDQIRISHGASQQDITSRKKFSKLKNLFIKRKKISVKKNSVFRDQLHGRPRILQNAQHMDSYANDTSGKWCRNMSKGDHQMVGECQCTVAKEVQSGNTLPELYAAKIKTGADIPQQFVFNAVGNPVQTHNDLSNNTFEHSCLTCGKNKKFFRIHPSSKRRIQPFQKFLPPNQNDKRNEREKNELEFQKELEFIKQDTLKGSLEKPGKTRLLGGTDNSDSYIVTSPHPQRIEVYYFDHGCSGYFRTTDDSPSLMIDMMIEKIDSRANKFWAEIFGFLQFITAIFVAFFLQLLRFLLCSILRPLLIGIIQISSDYFFKPLLAILFNSILQPIFILLFNIATSLKDICEIVAQALGYFLQEIANVCRAIRLVDIRNNPQNDLSPISTQNKPPPIDL